MFSTNYFPRIRPCLLVLSCIVSFFSVSQTVDIYIDNRVTSPYPNPTVIESNYLAAGFSTVNITSGQIDATVTASNYDVLFINEYYNYNSGLGQYVPNFLTAAQEVIAANFVSNGGHVVWISESWNTSPVSGGAIAQSTGMLSTINSLFGLSIAYGPYFNNGGMGSPNMPRVHPSNGPGALSASASIISSGSYSTLINVPSENAVYTSDLYDNTNLFDDCIHTTVALFPAFPTSLTGSIIASTEVATPFVGYSNSPFWPPPPPTYNTVFDQAIAQLHFNLITNVSMTTINAWSSDPSAVNIDCIPIILPLDLIKFNANYSSENSNVDLTWKTATETDLNNFFVERSNDLKSWQYLGTVDSHGNSQMVIDYSFIDLDPFDQTSYYRLRSNDLNGDYEYSEIRAVHDESAHVMHLFPNPIQNVVRISGHFEVNTSIEVFSILGQNIKNISNLDIKTREVCFSTENLSTGKYFVKITTPNEVSILPFNKVESL